jgi:hypothetical protein
VSRTKFSLTAKTGFCQVKSSRERRKRREAANGNSFPREQSEEFTRDLLLGDDEGALLSFEAEFDYAAIRISNDCGVGRLGVAIFPTAFGFGDGLLAINEDQVIAINHRAIIANLHIGFADMNGMSDSQALGHGLRDECGRKCENRYESQSLQCGMRFHCVNLSIERVSRNHESCRES